MKVINKNYREWSHGRSKPNGLIHVSNIDNFR